MSCSKQSVPKRAIQVSLGKMSEKDEWRGVIRRGGEEGKIAVRVSTADDLGTRRAVEGEALGTDGRAAIVADLLRPPP